MEDIAKGHAEILFDRIGELLTRNNLGYKDLNLLAVTTGPGSFTGMRIGLSAARGLGLALDIPVLGVPTLLAMSLSAPTDQSSLILLDARRNETYCQHFSAPGKPAKAAELLPTDKAKSLSSDAACVLEMTLVDIAVMADFAISADPQKYPPHPFYLRAADAKPQTKGKVARAAPSGTGAVR
jgi:tRNA threonylcarbamoyladenosine biosynthesis protein TsaB